MFQFTIDKWLDRYVFPNQVHRLPGPLRRVLGGHAARPVSDHWLWLSTLVSTFCGILLLMGVFRSHTVFGQHHAPVIFASYGASAILCFNATQSPLSQPRNVLFGHFVASVIGVCILELFSLLRAGRDNLYIGGALSVAVLSVVMSILGCVHPPAGASALLPLIDSQVAAMGWWFLPAQLVSLVLILATACVTMNLVRTYPVYWWSPCDVSKAPVTAKTSEAAQTSEAATSTISILAHEINVPENLAVDENEMEWLRSVQETLKKMHDI